jgi:hypothetical protein
MSLEWFPNFIANEIRHMNCNLKNKTMTVSFLKRTNFVENLLSNNTISTCVAKCNKYEYLLSFDENFVIVGVFWVFEM